MSPFVPPRFIDIYTASSRTGEDVNIMGVVTDHMPISKSKGTDWTCTFSLADYTRGTLGQIGEEGLKVRLFKTIASELPQIQGTGDVVVLRNVKVKEWAGIILAISTYGSNWTVIPAASIPVKAPSSQALQLQYTKVPKAPPLSRVEMLYAIELCNSNDRELYKSTAPEPAPTTTSTYSGSPATKERIDKFSLIKDLQIDTYRDLAGQIVKSFPKNDRVELYLTDYTGNNLLWNYDLEYSEGAREGDEYGYIPRNNENQKWPGPWGKQTLTVTLWPPHSYFAQSNIKVDDFVHLRNVHIKWSKDAKIEGVLHSDRRYPERIDVIVLKNCEEDDQIKDVLRRKKDYWSKHKKRGPESDTVGKGTKRKSPEDGKQLSKTQARKKRKQEREQAARSDNSSANKENEQERPIEKKPIPETTKQDLNPNIRCSHHTISPRPLTAIKSLDHHQNTTPAGNTYTLPFQNIKSRATVKIVNFFPPDLVDFAVPYPKKREYDVLSDVSDEPTSSGDDQTMPSQTAADDGRRWEWRFALTLEDALASKSRNGERERLKVYVTGADAECLLKLDAENLKTNAGALAALREKLFLLWGDLEERKVDERKVLEDGNDNKGLEPKGKAGGEEVKGRAFQCCLKEYGIKVRKRRDGGDDGGWDQDRDGERLGGEDEEDWTWERRWRMWGCTII
ncbi:MAG: hypothetical protein Q9164_000045 [Protoblastenia rupestris]